MALSPVAAAADHPAFKHAFNLPPGVALHYRIRAKQHGLMLDGESSLTWQVNHDKYHVTTEVRAMLVGKILSTSSQGAIDEYGLAPAYFVEKRFRKKPTTTTFERDKKIIRFTASAQSYPLTGGEQDYNSIIWQLVAQARGAAQNFRTGSEWRYFVASRNDADAWTFRVGKTEPIRTGQGTVNAVQVSQVPAAGGSRQQLDIWLAPSMEWYPARLRYTEPDGDYIEQTLDGLRKL